MEKIIEVTLLGRMISMEIFRQRKRGLSHENPLYSKELDRARSMVRPIVVEKSPGTLGV